MTTKFRVMVPWALVVGALLVAAVMGAGLAQLGHGLPGYFNDDAANGIYLHHQVHDALTAGRLTLADPLQFHPFGYNPVHTNGGNILEMLVSGMARIILPWPTWMAVGGLLWIPLNLVAFLPLGRRLWNDPRVILAAGAAWAVMPPALAQLAGGRWTQLALVGLPLAIAGLLDVTERGGRRSIGLAAVGWALTGIGYWFNALFLAILLPIFALYGVQRRDPWPCVRDLLLSGALAVVLVSPLLITIFWPALTGDGMPGTHVPSTDLNPVFPDALQLVGGQKPGTANWLPWVMVPGVLWTAVRGHRRWLWLGLATLCVVFALGPAQELGGRVWRLPYYPVWQSIPGLARMFHTERWLLVGGLFIAIASVDAIGRWRPWVSWCVPLGMLFQLHLSQALPIGTWTPSLPDHWAHVAQEEATGAIVVLPIMHAQLTSTHQPFHGRALLGGMIEDQPWATPEGWRTYIEDSPLLKSLRGVSYGRRIPVQIEADDLSILRRDGFDTVVFDAASWGRLPFPVQEDPRPRLEAALGTPVFRSESGWVWRLPQPDEE